MTTTGVLAPRRPAARIRPTRAFERIRRYLRARRRSDRCRVLLVAGSYRDMPVGDTAVATQHMPFLRQFGADVDVTVWTGRPEVWTWLCPDVRTAAPSRRVRADRFDVAVFETTLGAQAVEARLARAGVVVVGWHAGSSEVSVSLGATTTLRVPLPPLLNRTIRIAEVYRRLGFATPRKPRPRPLPSGPPVLYLNPYGSHAGKCMSLPLLRRLLRAVTRRGEGWRVVVPARPARAASRHERSVFDALAAVASEAGTNGVEVRPRVTLAQYCRDIEASAVVIGTDTSSQHLAAAIGRPSITCYPSRVGRHFHLFWGTVAATALHLDAPPDSAHAAQIALATLVVALTTQLLGPVGSWSGDAWWIAARRCVDGCRRFLTGQAPTRRSAGDALRRLRRLTPPAWVDAVCAELTQVYEELPVLRAAPVAQRRAAAARLRHLSAPRITRVLAGR
jgi:hypothetical protein